MPFWVEPCAVTARRPKADAAIQGKGRRPTISWIAAPLSRLAMTARLLSDPATRPKPFWLCDLNFQNR